MNFIKKPIIDKLEILVMQLKRYLDLGCGNGYFTNMSLLLTVIKLNRN